MCKLGFIRVDRTHGENISARILGVIRSSMLFMILFEAL